MKKLILITAMFWSLASQAQCAMCKAAAESGQQGGDSIVDGLNDGILYLMAFPYILIGGVGYMWWRHNHSRKEDN